jgi:hypothetical protein
MKTELIIFIVVLLGNGAVALWKKYKEQAASRPEAAPRPTASPRPAPRPRLKPAGSAASPRRQPQQPTPQPIQPAREPVPAPPERERPAAVVAAAAVQVAEDRNPPQRRAPRPSQPLLAAKTAPRNGRALGNLRQWVVGAEILGAPRWRAPLH